ncbi:hypothetical protein REPUB_Repub16aG0138800 [Reevesia pubescens]
MRDMVYLLVLTCEVKVKGQRIGMEDIKNSNGECEVNESLGDPETTSDEKRKPDLSFNGPDMNDEYESTSAVHEDEKMEDQEAETTMIADKPVDFEQLNGDRMDVPGKPHVGACWDVFRRQDVPKLIEYLRMHWKDFGKPESAISNSVTCPLYDEVIYLNEHHKRKLRQEFVTVQLGLDFLFPESVGEAVRLAEDIRCLPNEHDGELQILEGAEL